MFWYQILQHSIRGQAESRSHWVYTGSWGSPWWRFWEKLQGKHLVFISTAVWSSVRCTIQGLGIMGCFSCNYASVNMHIPYSVHELQFHHQHVHQYQQWVQNLVLVSFFWVPGTLVPVAAGCLSNRGSWESWPIAKIIGQTKETMLNSNREIFEIMLNWSKKIRPLCFIYSVRN